MKQVGDRVGTWSASAPAIAVALGAGCEAEKVWTFSDAVADAPMARERPLWPDAWRGGPDPALIRTAEQP